MMVKMVEFYVCFTLRMHFECVGLSHYKELESSRTVEERNAVDRCEPGFPSFPVSHALLVADFYTIMIPAFLHLTLSQRGFFMCFNVFRYFFLYFCRPHDIIF